MKVFQYCIVYYPESEKEGKELPPVLLKDVTTVLASDASKAGIMAARAIPEEHVNHLENIEVIIRPF